MKRYKIGYTTGTFDLFHIGHLNILKKSKEMCDFLIVGVSTDEVEIIKSIRYVDQVVPQLSMDKFQAWSELHFDVMFHGDDWKGSSLYNEYESRLKEVGVEVVYIPHTEGVSSSMLTDEIKYGK